MIWFSNLLTMYVPDEGYSRNSSCALNIRILRITRLVHLLVHSDIHQVVSTFVELLFIKYI